MYDLPESYNDNCLVLMVRDPHCLYTYWDVSKSKKESFYEEYGQQLWENSVPALRVTNISKNSSFFIRINEFCNDWYINVEDTNSIYTVEFGRRTQKQEFISLMKSNYVLAQEFSGSENTAIIFADYKELKNNDIESRAVNTYSIYSSGKDSGHVIGINPDDLFEYNLQDLLFGTSSMESIKTNLARHLGVSSFDVFRHQV